MMYDDIPFWWPGKLTVWIDCWIGIRSGRHFISLRGWFSWRLFWQTLERSRSAGLSMLVRYRRCVPHSRKPSKWLWYHHRRVQKNQNPSRQEPVDCNDISRGNCAMIHSTSGVRPTRSPYLRKIPCTQWLPSTCTLTEYDSSVTVHKSYTQPFHTLNHT